MKEQNQLKNIVNNLIHPKHHCGRLKGTLRSLKRWSALARRQGKMIIRSAPTSAGMDTNVRASCEASPPISLGRPTNANRRFVSISWVEIVLAGEGVYVLGYDRIILGVHKRWGFSTK